LIAVVRSEYAVASHAFQHACSVICGTVQDGSTLYSVRIGAESRRLMNHAQVGSFSLVAVVGVWQIAVFLASYAVAMRQ